MQICVAEFRLALRKPKTGCLQVAYRRFVDQGLKKRRRINSSWQSWQTQNKFCFWIKMFQSKQNESVSDKEASELVLGFKKATICDVWMKKSL
jgi:hypothetical protein